MNTEQIEREFCTYLAAKLVDVLEDEGVGSISDDSLAEAAGWTLAGCDGDNGGNVDIDAVREYLMTLYDAREIVVTLVERQS